MKAVPFIVFAILALTGAARADEYAGPPPPPAMQRPQRPMGPLRAALLERFDANHDGRLEPNERRHAMRALRRMERQLARGDRQQRRALRAERRQLRQTIRRYDLNGDGNVDPSEMPPGAADRMRRMDRNGDGWVDERDFH
jgi:Ca2+-binding EF-hand superfamily protein